MNSSTLRLVLILVSATASLNAMADRTTPTCPVPNGVTCMSTAEVYQATNDADKVTSRAQGQMPTAMPMPATTSRRTVSVQAPPPQPSGPVAYRPAEYAHLAVQGNALVISNTVSEEQAPVRSTADRAEPYRVPAQIMQIFVAPWTDEQGDLHLPERVVTEIEPRHWALGAPAPDAGTSFRLLELPGEAAQDARQAVPANTARSTSGLTATTAIKGSSQ